MKAAQTVSGFHAASADSFDPKLVQLLAKRLRVRVLPRDGFESRMRLFIEAPAQRGLFPYRFT
jgi:hypothetical protein